MGELRSENTASSKTCPGSLVDRNGMTFAPLAWEQQLL